jgi:hypothetical protein
MYDFKVDTQELLAVHRFRIDPDTVWMQGDVCAL